MNQLLRSNKRYISNLATTFLTQAISVGSIFILTPIFLKSLGTFGFSMYSVILNLIIYSAVIDFGMNFGLQKKMLS